MSNSPHLNFKSIHHFYFQPPNPSDPTYPKVSSFPPHLVKAFTLAPRCRWVGHHTDVTLSIQQLTSHLKGWPQWDQGDDLTAWYAKIYHDILIWMSWCTVTWFYIFYDMITNENYTSWIVIHINWTQVSNLFDFSRTSCFRPNLFGTRISNTRPCLERTEKCLLFFSKRIWFGMGQVKPCHLYFTRKNNIISEQFQSISPLSKSISSQFLCTHLPGSRAQGRKMMSP